jgi:phosphate uptake regulator
MPYAHELTLPADRPTDRSSREPLSTEALSEQTAMSFAALNDRVDKLFDLLSTMFEQQMQQASTLRRIERKLEEHGSRLTLAERDIECRIG